MISRTFLLIGFASILSSCDSSPKVSTRSTSDSGMTNTKEMDASNNSNNDAGIISHPDANVGAPDATPAWMPGEDTSVVVFEAGHVFFGSENKRQIDVSVSLPPSGRVYKKISLDFNLGCPDGACDWWDRVGWMGIVQNPGSEEERVLEIHRYITSYRVATSWTVDVTDFQSLLTGDVTFRVFIDTWVGPGHANGNGWLVDARLNYEGGIPERVPVAVEPLFKAERIVYGNPMVPTSPVRTQTLTVPDGASQVSIISFITGHGQGNSDNCAEFCPKNHSVTVNGETRTNRLWRDDCARTAPEQYGNRESPRAGWCPGTSAPAWQEVLNGSYTKGDSLEISYDIEAYVNTCSPDNCMPSSCAPWAECEYDGSGHTEPNYLVSMIAVFYE